MDDSPGAFDPSTFVPFSDPGMDYLPQPFDYSKISALGNIGFDPTSSFSDYDFNALSKLGFKPGDSIQGLDANRFYKYSYPDQSQDNKWYQTEYTNQNGKWVPGQTKYGQEVKGDFKDFVKTGAPLALSMIPGVGTGLSSMFGGGILGNLGAGAVLGAGNAAIQGGDIGKGALYGGLGSGIGMGVNAVNPAGMVGINSKSLGTLFNRGITTGLNSAVQGGNVGKAVGTTLLTGGLNLAGKELGNLGQGTNIMDNSDSFYNPIGFGQDTYSTGQGSGNFLTNPGYNRNYNFTQGDVGFDVPNLFSSPTQQTEGQGALGTTGGNPLLQFFSSQLGGKGAPGLGDMAGSLLGLYQANRQRRAMGQQAGALSAMFSQNSPYASTLRNQLSRRDAAGGRRSQYGPREVELQAKLAQMASGNAPAFMQAQNGADQARAMMMRNLLQLGNQTGAFKGLAGLFGG